MDRIAQIYCKGVCWYNDVLVSTTHFEQIQVYPYLIFFKSTENIDF